MTKPPLTIILAKPRGFCAGVVRAIDIVKAALVKYGAPVYVRHEIVHNQHVVKDLREKGAIFIDELDEIPEHHRHCPVIFSAHGVPKSVPEQADAKNLFALDATCPLVTKVHNEVERHYRKGRKTLLIGHAGHPEVIGTMGQIPHTHIHLIENQDDIDRLDDCDEAGEKLAYATQTTLSVDDTTRLIDKLKQRFPNIHGPRKEDICYATTNRQSAIRNMAKDCDQIFVIGANNSSNSRRLVDVAREAGCPKASLITSANDVDWHCLKANDVVGLSAGASAPENLVQEFIKTAYQHYDVTLKDGIGVEESTFFRLPRLLQDVELEGS